MPLLEKVVHFSCGWQHGLILTQSRLLGFGSNKFGQLGTEQPVASSSLVEIATQVRFAKVYCGFHSSFAITEEKELLGCGYNKSGELGGTSEAAAERRFVKIMGGIVRVRCGQRFVLALDEKKDLYGWGSTGYGQVERKEVHRLASRVRDFDAGWSHHIVLRGRRVRGSFQS